MTNKYYQKQKEKLWKEKHEKYQNLPEEGKKNGKKGQSYNVIAFGIFLDNRQLMKSFPTKKYGSNYYYKWHNTQRF